MMQTVSERILYVQNHVAKLGSNEFAESIGVKAQTVWNWTNGKHAPDIKSLGDICQRHLIAPEWLLLGTGPIMNRREQLPFIKEIEEIVQKEPLALAVFTLYFQDALKRCRKTWPTSLGEITLPAAVGGGHE